MVLTFDLDLRAHLDLHSERVDVTVDVLKEGLCRPPGQGACLRGEKKEPVSKMCGFLG